MNRTRLPAASLALAALLLPAEVAMTEDASGADAHINPYPRAAIRTERLRRPLLDEQAD